MTIWENMTSLKRHSLRIVALFLFQQQKKIFLCANNLWQRYHKHKTKKKGRQVRKIIVKERKIEEKIKGKKKEKKEKDSKKGKG